MKKSTKKLMSYALGITMLFNAATVNQNNKVDISILPEPIKLEKVKEVNDLKLKKALK